GRGRGQPQRTDREPAMSLTPLSLDTAMRRTAEAFPPYLCTTERAAGQDAFGFTVRSITGAQLLNVPQVSHFQYAHPLRLAGVLEQARLDLTHKGCHLEDWHMPFIPDPDSLPETPPNY